MLPIALHEEEGEFFLSCATAAFILWCLVDLRYFLSFALLISPTAQVVGSGLVYVFANIAM